MRPFTFRGVIGSREALHASITHIGGNNFNNLRDATNRRNFRAFVICTVGRNNEVTLMNLLSSFFFSKLTSEFVISFKIEIMDSLAEKLDFHFFLLLRRCYALHHGAVLSSISDFHFSSHTDCTKSDRIDTRNF